MNAHRLNTMLSDEFPSARPLTGLTSLVPAGVLLGLLISSMASAHCWPVDQSPSVGSTLENAPSEIRIRFSQPVREAGSTLLVKNDEGDRVETAPARRPDEESDVLMISLPPLTPGRYQVWWTAMTFDGHQSEGDYFFSIRSK